MEFFNDLQDLINIFIDIFNDPSYRNRYDNELKEKLNRLSLDAFPLSTQSAIFLRADMMLDYLYDKPIGIKEKDIIEKFYLD
jgi:hypothetical protein